MCGGRFFKKLTFITKYGRNKAGFLFFSPKSTKIHRMVYRMAEDVEGCL
jgi:hypothetical protein